MSDKSAYNRRTSWSSGFSNSHHLRAVGILVSLSESTFSTEFHSRLSKVDEIEIKRDRCLLKLRENKDTHHSYRQPEQCEMDQYERQKDLRHLVAMDPFDS